MTGWCLSCLGRISLRTDLLTYHSDLCLPSPLLCLILFPDVFPFSSQVIKICNLILKSHGIRPTRHSSAERGNEPINKCISCLSLPLAAAKQEETLKAFHSSACVGLISNCPPIFLLSSLVLFFARLWRLCVCYRYTYTDMFCVY